MSVYKQLVWMGTATLLLAGVARSSWLSDVTGINIDVSKAIGQPIILNDKDQPHAIQTLPPLSVPVAMAKPEQIAILKTQIDKTVDKFSTESGKYDSYAISWAVASIALALAAAIAGFLRKPVAAGVLSLVVMASTGAAKEIPIRERASYYQTLYGQALTLQLDVAVADTLTKDEFNSYSIPLEKLLLYASKLPGVGDVGPLITEIIKDTRVNTSSK